VAAAASGCAGRWPRRAWRRPGRRCGGPALKRSRGGKTRSFSVSGHEEAAAPVGVLHGAALKAGLFVGADSPRVVGRGIGGHRGRPLGEQPLCMGADKGRAMARRPSSPARDDWSIPRASVAERQRGARPGVGIYPAVGEGSAVSHDPKRTVGIADLLR
jgi:hypothetical protein